MSNALRQDLHSNQLAETYLKKFAENILLASVSETQHNLCQKLAEHVISTDYMVIEEPENWKKIHYYTALHKGMIGHHGTKYFLPWHRAFLFEFERDLKMPIPFWNWLKNPTVPLSLQRDHISALDWVTFLGGIDQNSDTHLRNYFTNLERKHETLDRNEIVDGNTYNPHHFVQGRWKNISNKLFRNASQIKEDRRYLWFNWFKHFSLKLDSGPHGDVHVWIGGVTDSDRGHLADVTVSTLDPLFWLHHSFVDKLWADYHSVLFFRDDREYRGYPKTTLPNRVKNNPYDTLDSYDLRDEYNYSDLLSDDVAKRIQVMLDG